MISAGEASGDLHGASLAQAAQRTPELKFFGLGGDQMRAAGVELVAHLSETAVMGLTEVVGSLGRILNIQKTMANLLVSQPPAALVAIDSPDFNFPLVKKAHKLGIPVIYYICPQIWAWRSGRLKFLARYCDRRVVIFPFEKDYYEKRGVSADLVGHPLLDRLNPLTKLEARKILGLNPDQPVLALLPGSRQALVKRLAPPLLQAAEILGQKFPDLQVALPRAQSLAPAFLSQILRRAPALTQAKTRVYDGQSQVVLAAADAALLASGTSTVEGTLLRLPMVVAYRTSALSYLLARLLVKVPYIAITNLLMGEMVIPELIQGQANPRLLAQTIEPLLQPGPARELAIAGLEAAAEKLGRAGAADRVLEIILEQISRAQKSQTQKKMALNEPGPCPSEPESSKTGSSKTGSSNLVASKASLSETNLAENCSPANPATQRAPHD
jgi:lipid-A-disaccharide synthase